MKFRDPRKANKHSQDTRHAMGFRSVPADQIPAPTLKQLVGVVRDHSSQSVAAPESKLIEGKRGTVPMTYEEPDSTQPMESDDDEDDDDD